MEWVDVEGYEGLYQVSRSGEIKSVERYAKSKERKYYYKPEKILKPTINNKGYFKVYLSKDGIGVNVFVHRIVANAFLRNENNLPQVNHINGNKTDNRVENLEWVSAKDNTQHAIRNGLFRTRKWRGEIMEKIIKRLIDCFHGSFVNLSDEFVAHRKANEYFRLEDCKDELDIKCKVLEWFSRGAYKTEPFKTEIKNDEYHNFMRNGINSFLGTDFSEEDMEQIYTYLGNCCNHKKTIQFIESGYDISDLKGKVE